MRGEVKKIASAQDFINLGGQGVLLLESAIAEAEELVWLPVGELDNESHGVEDGTHRVVEQGGGGFVQMELQPNPWGLLARLGLSIGDAKELLRSLETEYKTK